MELLNLDKEFIPYEQAELACLRKLIEIVNEKHTRTTNKYEK